MPRQGPVLHKKGLIMKKTTPSVIRLPMNSMVDAISISYWGKNRAMIAHQPPSLEFQHRRILPLKPYVDTLNENYMKFGFGIIHDGYISENRDYSTTLIITEGYGVYGWVL